MANYEIMLIMSGSLEEKVALDSANELATIFQDCNPKVEQYGSKPLAYKINADTTGYYFQYNFTCTKPATIDEFRRLCLINKNVLRHLIINVEKDHGYRASVNPKKVEINKKTAAINTKRKAEFEKVRLSRESARSEENDAAGFIGEKTEGHYIKKPYDSSRARTPRTPRAATSIRKPK